MGSAEGKPVSPDRTGKVGPKGLFSAVVTGGITSTAEEERSMKALVVYGSKHGGTAGLAEMICDEFRRRGWEVELRDAAGGEPIGDPDIVVVGGALYFNRWHRASRDFIRRNEHTLSAMPVWLFSSGPLDASARAGDLAPVARVQEI